MCRPFTVALASGPIEAENRHIFETPDVSVLGARTGQASCGCEDRARRTRVGADEPWRWSSSSVWSGSWPWSRGSRECLRRSRRGDERSWLDGHDIEGRSRTRTVGTDLDQFEKRATSDHVGLRRSRRHRLVGMRLRRRACSSANLVEGACSLAASNATACWGRCRHAGSTSAGVWANARRGQPTRETSLRLRRDGGQPFPNALRTGSTPVQR